MALFSVPSCLQAKSIPDWLRHGIFCLPDYELLWSIYQILCIKTTRNFDMNNLSERGIKVLASLGLILTTMIWGFASVLRKLRGRDPTDHLLASAFPCLRCCLLCCSIKYDESRPGDDSLWCDPGHLSMSVLSVQYIRPEVHDSQQECLYHHIICYHRAVLTGSSAKRDRLTEYHCRVSALAVVPRFCHCREISQSINRIF